MNKYIVTTTINSPTRATLLFCEKKDWKFVIVGDLKTPHDEYKALEKKYKNVIYLAPEDQEKQYKKLSDEIGWKTIERRNIGFIYSYDQGADIMATVDDDNVPYQTWGENVYIDKTVNIHAYESINGVFDPLSVTKDNYLWHRGYPIELLQSRRDVVYKGKIQRKVLVQSDLWDGDPDIDAIARLTHKPIVRYQDITEPYCSINISPFNSQNTFLSRKVLPYYAMLPFIGRLDDIWAAYILQKYFPDSVIYSPATVYQDRNKQDLITNLEHEIIGYRDTFRLINNLDSFEDVLPDRTKRFYDLYRKSFKI